MKTQQLSIFSEIKHYLKFGLKLQAYLTKDADDWQRFQEEFNSNLDKVYADILNFEKENRDDEFKIYKMKKIFEKRYRQLFLYGDYIKWCLEKPYGYAGDFKIIDDIYQNRPCSNGFTRLWDNWFQQLAAPKAVRERKDDFKKIISDFVKKNYSRDIRIFSLGSGPAREIKELLEEDSQGFFLNVTFDCYDYDINAIEYAKKLLKNHSARVNFFQKNAIRLALNKDIKNDVLHRYDLIYSAGLFDYLDERVGVRLVGNLKQLLREGGAMLISNFANRYDNPSVSWMEWVVEWYLIYRTEQEFKKIFLDAGIPTDNLRILIPQNKVQYYCLVKLGEF